MENGQVVLIVLASVLVGAVIPIVVMLCLVLYRAGREITATGRLLAPTLARAQVISERVEVLSRGLEGGDKSLAELVSVLGDMARTQDRNLKMIQVASTVFAAAAPAAAAFIQAMRAPDGDKGQAEGS